MGYVIHEHSRDDDSYLCSYSSFTFHVCSEEFGDEIESFSGSWDSDSSGDRRSGTQSVRIEGQFAVARDADGSEQRVELPARLELVEGGHGLRLVYADGRSLTRRRTEALATAKYGQLVSLHRLVGRP